MRESKVEAYFRKRVAETGGIERKVQWIGRRGCPDRWCGWPSFKRTAWIELKGDGGKLTKLQTQEILRLRSCGERVHVLVSTEDIDGFVEDITR